MSDPDKVQALDGDGAQVAQTSGADDVPKKDDGVAPEAADDALDFDDDDDGIEFDFGGGDDDDDDDLDFDIEGGLLVDGGDIDNHVNTDAENGASDLCTTPTLDTITVEGAAHEAIVATPKHSWTSGPFQRALEVQYNNVCIHLWTYGMNYCAHTAILFEL